MKNKRIVISVIIVVVALIFLGFGRFFNERRINKIANQNEVLRNGFNEEKQNVICTTYPIYLLTKAVVGYIQRNVVLLLPPDLGCPHDYALTPNDLMKLQSGRCILVINGLNLDNMISDAAKKVNPDIVVIDSSSNIPDILKEDETHSEHGEHEHDDEHQHDMKDKHEHDDNVHKHDHNHSHGGINPHLFGSPFQIKRIVYHISENLSKYDKNNASVYQKNADEYIRKLDDICSEYRKDAASWTKKCFATQHDVFGYLIRDLHLDNDCVLIKVSGESNPSAAEVNDIIHKIKEKKISVIFTEPQYSNKYPAMIAKECGIHINHLDPCATGPENASPEYFLEILQKNLETMNKYLR